MSETPSDTPPEPLGETPPEPLGETASEPASPRRSRKLWELGVWLTLLGLVTGIVLLTLLAPPPADLQSSAGSLELRFQARYAVGVNALLESSGMKALPPANLGQELVDQLHTAAATHNERLTLVPVVAELQGPDTALGKIAELRQEIEPDDTDDIDDIDDIDDTLRQDLEAFATLYGGGTLDEAPRAALRERRGELAILALTHGEPDDPERQEILARARRTALAMVTVAAGAMGATLVGLVLFVIAVVLYRKGKLRPHYRPRRDTPFTWRIPHLETLVVFILATLGISVVVGLLIDLSGNLPLALATTMLALPAIFWPYVRQIPRAEVSHALGWHRGEGVLKEIGCGLVGYITGLPLLFVGILLTLVLARFVDAPARHPLMQGVAEAGPLGLIVLFILAAVWAPVVEETVFRGGFYHYLRGRFGAVASAFSVALVFAVIHPQGILGVPPLVALAVILALLREWRGSLIASVTVHAVHNAVATVLIILVLG